MSRHAKDQFTTEKAGGALRGSRDRPRVSRACAKQAGDQPDVA
jgi:hypothetical protein